MQLSYRRFIAVAGVRKGLAQGFCWFKVKLVRLEDRRFAAMAGVKLLALLALVAFVFVALVPRTVVAWGADGHHSTCLLAEVSLCALLNPLLWLSSFMCVNMLHWVESIISASLMKRFSAQTTVEAIERTCLDRCIFSSNNDGVLNLVGWRVLTKG